MDRRSMELAEEVIRAADREHPADDVLKQLFVRKRTQPAPSGERVGLPSTEVTHAVFDYYRWLGCLDTKTPLAQQILQARDLAQRFRKSPESFSDAELLDRALPAWIKEEVSVSADLVRAFQKVPALWVRARKGTGNEIGGKLRDCERLGPGRLSDALRYFGAKDLFKTPEFHAGDIQIQDVSSQAVGLLCNPQPGETWWDACAGQGGKTIHLADLMENKGLIWASDRAEWRLKKLRARMAKAKVFNYRAVIWDGGPRPPTKTRFDGVLVDAPCSGVGTWHRNPHARWTTVAEDVRELAGIQVGLLAHAAPTLKPGGLLIYSVCTITRSETDGVADAFEARFPEFQPVLLGNPLREGSAPTARHWFLPQDFGGNGMFAACWERRA